MTNEHQTENMASASVYIPIFCHDARYALSVQLRAQRSLSRKQDGSANQDKARIKVARAHARVADTRRDLHHQLCTRLIRENQAVAVEGLAVSALGRTRMAKSVHDAGWSAFVTMLEYKARLRCRAFHRIGRFEPTTWTCSACGRKDGPKCRRDPRLKQDRRSSVPASTIGQPAVRWAASRHPYRRDSNVKPGAPGAALITGESPESPAAMSVR